jgi:transcriptional regulator with XRE-family HTH domain
MYIVMTERVRELREEKGMSKGDLAEAAGVSLTTARRAERGLPVLNTTARALVEALGERPTCPELGTPVRRVVG